MLNSEVFDIMAGRLGRRAATLIRTICIQELNLAIRELERGPTKPWFLEDIAEGNFVAEQGYITLPSDFLTEVEEGVFEVEHEDDGWIELVKVSREKLKEETQGEDDAFPEGYALWGNRALLGPTPDDTYAYRFDYYKRTTAVPDSGAEVTNSWLLEFFDYVTYFALIKVARDHIQNSAKAAEMIQGFNTAKDAFEREVTARRVTNETLLLTNEES